MDFTPGEISHEDTIGLKEPSGFRLNIELADRFEPTKESDFGDQSTELSVEAAKESEEPMNEALKNIHNMIHIRGSNILFVALADWERSEKAYRKRVHRKKKVLRNTRIEVITLTGFFLALQGFLLTAAAVSSSSQCTNLGFLLAVSGLVTFCVLAFVCHKEVTMRRLQSVIMLEKAVQKTFTSRLQQLRQEGEFFDFERTNDYIIKSTEFALRLFGFSFTAMAWVALAIGIFGVLCLVTIHRLLCHSS
jgi:hypothetical protein